MLIDDVMKPLLERGILALVEPMDFRANRERAIYASADLHRFLIQDSADSETNNNRRRVQRLFDRFTSGASISVVLERRLKGSDIKRLSPPQREVWEFKVKGRGQIQLRTFGRFYLRDAFVALTGPVDRPDCDYDAEMTRCEQEWNTILPGRAPIHGSTVDAYISTKRLSL
jgi:hypothetical protein